MTAQFPSALKTFTTKRNDIDLNDANHINALQDEIVALEAKVGINGSADTNSLDYKVNQEERPVSKGGTGRSSHTAYAVICGGTTTTSAQQSVASVGSSGQVLTSNGAGALPTFQDADTGTASSIDLDWSNAILPDTNFPSLGKTVGTNFVYKTLDFDPTTDEACYWNAQIPTDLTPVSAKAIVYWTASGGTATHASYWQITTRSLNNDEVIDATTTPSTATDSGNDALIATGDLHVFEIALTITGWTAGDMIQIKFNRDADNGSDNLAVDAKIIKVVLEIR